MNVGWGGGSVRQQNIENNIMTLTDEQSKRMEENRLRALKIKRKRELEREQRETNNIIITEAGSSTSNIFQDGGFVPTEQNEGTKGSRSIQSTDASAHVKESNTRTNERGVVISSNTNNNGNDEDLDDDESSLEEFEHNASQYITQTEAQRSYCLPMGTLDVCSYIERDNPHKRGWSKMKLYARKEVRRRARKRFGGKAGLIQERESRKRKRLEKDLEEMKDVFCSR